MVFVLLLGNVDDILRRWTGKDADLESRLSTTQPNISLYLAHDTVVVGLLRNGEAQVKSQGILIMLFQIRGVPTNAITRCRQGSVHKMC